MPRIWDRMLLIPQLARLGAKAPKDSNTAWEGYWGRISRTGMTGQVLWDADSAAEKATYASLVALHLDATLPIIDVGCGNGTFTRALAPLFPSALGIDVAASAIRRANEENDANGARFQTVDAVAPGAGAALLEQLGPANVFVRGVLHVLSPSDRIKLVDNLHTVVGARGRVFLAETNFTGGSLKYVEHLGASRRHIPEPLKLAVEGLPKPNHFGRPERESAFPSKSWVTVADGATTIEAVPMNTGGLTERIPGYFAVLAPR